MSIDCKVFRINNWVECEYGFALVTELRRHNNMVGVTLPDFNNYVFENADIKPIPLNPEILEKCGCNIRERMSDRWAFLEGYYWIPVVGHSLVVGFENGKCFLYHYLESFAENSVDELCELTSLHHFQNVIFALTGEELEPKL